MPKKIINLETSSNESESESESEPEQLTKSKVKEYIKPKKVLSEKQKAVLENARNKRMENIQTSKTNKKIEAAKTLIEHETNLKVKETKEPIKKKSKKKTIIIESESDESSSEEEIIVKRRSKKKPIQKAKVESEEEEEEEEPKPKRALKAQISKDKLNKHKVFFDGFC